jgi:hypothetical protein
MTPIDKIIHVVFLSTWAVVRKTRFDVQGRKLLNTLRIRSYIRDNVRNHLGSPLHILDFETINNRITWE